MPSNLIHHITVWHTSFFLLRRKKMAPLPGIEPDRVAYNVCIYRKKKQKTCQFNKNIIIRFVSVKHEKLRTHMYTKSGKYNFYINPTVSLTGSHSRHVVCSQSLYHSNTSSQTTRE